MSFIPAAVFALLGALLQLPVLLVQGFGPAPNLPIATLSVWFLYINISTFINFTWWVSDNVDTWNSGEGWCDIDASMFSAANFGVLLGMLSISINLFYLSKPSARRLSPKKMRVWQVADCLILFVIPIAFAISRPFMSATRYGIFQNLGCSAALPMTRAYIFFYLVIPAIIALIMTGLSICTILQFVLRGRESVYQALRFKEKFSVNFYFRTMAFAVMVLVICVPLIIVQFASTFILQNRVISAMPWAHGQPETWNLIEGATWDYISSDHSTRTMVLINVAYRILLFILSYICFFCFGMGDTAIVCYRGWLVMLGIISCEPNYINDTELRSPVSWTSSETKKNEISVHVGSYVPSP